MNKCRSIMQYETLLGVAKEWPMYSDIWRILSKVAPTLSASVNFLKLADFLQNKKTSRKYIYLDSSRHDVTSVTFVVLAWPIMGRVNKVAHAARAAGLKIQLMLCFQYDQSVAIEPSLYDEIIVVNDMHLHLNEALKRIREFRSSLIHMFVDCCTNYQAALWSVRSPLPLVGDAYDLCCAQYTSWPDNPEALKQNVFFENIWLQHMDGFCTRTHYLKTKRLQSVYRTGIPVYYMPDPVRTNCLALKPERADPKTVHIVIDGLGSTNSVYSKAFEEVYSQVKQAGNIHLYIYRYTGRDLSEYKDIIHTYPRLPGNVLAQLFYKCDAFLLPWCSKYFKDSGYSYAMAKYGTRTTAAEVMEADCINIIPDNFELIGKNAVKCNRGIVFNETEQKNIEFWRALPGKIAELQGEPSNCHRFFDTTMARHLSNFYQRVVGKVVLRQAGRPQK